MNKCFFFAALALALMSGPARAEPANSVRDLFANLDHCLKQSSFAQEGEITLFFSLRQDGSLFGKPRVTYFRSLHGSAAHSAFLESFAGAFGACFPAEISAKLGMAVAGRPLTMRFVLKGRETDI